MPKSPHHHFTELSCSFCGKKQTEVGKLIAGPSPTLCICDACTSRISADIGAKPVAWKKVKPSHAAPTCSFCSRPEGEVWKIFAQNDTTICDDCIDLCNAILAEEKSR